MEGKSAVRQVNFIILASLAQFGHLMRSSHSLRLHSLSIIQQLRLKIIRIKLGAIPSVADGKTVGLIAADLWVDVATVEAQAPSARRRSSTYRPEVAVRALVHRSASRTIGVPSIRKREWELWCNIFYFAADGKAIGLIVAVLWVDVATVEVQVPSVRRRVSTCRPEVAARALVHCRTRRLIDAASIRKREWELL